MDYDLKCPSCQKDFNVKNIPLELPCHHSYCSKCIQKSIDEQEDGNVICQLDSQIFNIEFDDIPISRIYTKFIKANKKTKSNKKLLCMKHEDKKIRYICLNDQEFLCSSCILDHYDHKDGITNYNFSDFYNELDLMENLLNDQKAKLDKSIKKIEKLKNNKKSYSEEVEKFFFKSIDLLPSKTKKKLSFPLIYVGKSVIEFDLKKEINNELIPESKIITTEIFEILNEFFENKLKSYKLLFRASEHNFKAAAFHKECDNKGENLVIIRSKKGYIFGGYSVESWKDPNMSSLRGSIFNFDQKMISKVFQSFLFSIDNHKKYEVLDPNDNIIINNSNYGPHFGKEDEGLHICDNCNINQQSYGLIYSDIYNNIAKASSKKEAVSVFFDKNKYFLVDEYEVFSLS